MKKKKLGLRIGIGICAAFGWWGVLYPELTMVPETYRIVLTDGTVQEEPGMLELGLNSDIYQQILNAGQGQVRFKSKLLEVLRKD